MGLEFAWGLGQRAGVAVPEKLILRNFQSAGDIVMLTAAVRDLHRSTRAGS